MSAGGEQFMGEIMPEPTRSRIMSKETKNPRLVAALEMLCEIDFHRDPEDASALASFFESYFDLYDCNDDTEAAKATIEKAMDDRNKARLLRCGYCSGWGRVATPHAGLSASIECTMCNGTGKKTKEES